MPELVVYTRRGCHLCEDLIEELGPLVRGLATLTVRDVDSREDWREAYGLRVPVVEGGGDMLCQYHLDREAVLGFLNEPATGGRKSRPGRL